MRWLVINLVRAILAAFFRRIEVVGAEHVPEQGGVLFVLNHPNGLIDPLFVWGLRKERVSFLGKAPLFKMPVIGWFARTLDALPVYRAQDGADTSGNSQTLDAVSQALAQGRRVAIFPEGTSHSAPTLEPLKTGAARIALAASRHGPVRVVPMGLNYEAKAIFRSHAVVTYGPPIDIKGEGTDPLAKDNVVALTKAIRDGLDDVVVQAGHPTGIAAMTVGVWLAVSGPVGGEGAGPEALETILSTARRAYRELSIRDPERLTGIFQKLKALGDFEQQAGFATWVPNASSAAIFGSVIMTAPLGLVGMLWHAPAYFGVKLVAALAKQPHDVTATVKVLAGLVFYPLTWAITGAIIGSLWGPAWSLVALAGPVAAWAGLKFRESLADAEQKLRMLLATRDKEAWVDYCRRRADAYETLTSLPNISPRTES